MTRSRLVVYAFTTGAGHLAFGNVTLAFTGPLTHDWVTEITQKIRKDLAKCDDVVLLNIIELENEPEGGAG